MMMRKMQNLSHHLKILSIPHRLVSKTPYQGRFYASVKPLVI